MKEFVQKHFFIIFCLSHILSQGCSLEERKSSRHRGHTENYGGVEHGFAALKGPRFCKECHGVSLAGGSSSEPSCFQCHGFNWRDVDPNVSAAPDDHTVVLGGFTHQPAHDQPSGTCTNCHGANLTGDTERLSPSCYLCHGSVWDK